MLQELRESITPLLSRQQLADLLNRSPNYILKAESLTFPNVPPALLDFYTTHLDYPRPLLISEYRSAQRSRRRRWLHRYKPVQLSGEGLSETSGAVSDLGDVQLRAVGRSEGINDWPNGISFCNSWVHQYKDETPTQYAVSQGLCVPAAGVYGLEKTGLAPRSIRVALRDLVEYCETGEALGETHLTEEDIDRTLKLCARYLK